MTEVRTVLSDASPASIVLLDELGKGTEVSAATAIAGDPSSFMTLVALI